MSAREIYDAYVSETDPSELLQMDRRDIASQLMVDSGLGQEDAYYATDQILEVAQQLAQTQSEER
jgi:hypothetical protein